MRKTKLAIFVMFFLTFSVLFAKAESDLLSYMELLDQGYIEWIETYSAHGRQVNIDIEIKMPNVNKIPVLKVKKYHELSDNAVNDFQKRFQFDQVTNKPGQILIVYNDVHKEIINAKSFYSVKSVNLDLCDNKYSLPNELLCFFKDLLDGLLQDNAVLLSSPIKVTYNQYVDDNDRPLSKEGFYAFSYNQLLHGIPVISNIRAHYRNPIRSEKGVFLMANEFCVKNRESFNLNLNLVEEIECVYNDVPVCSVEKVKATVENLIEMGLVRSIQRIELGYVLHDDLIDNSIFWAIPTWLVHCEYFDSPKIDWGEKISEPRTTAILAINAQRGTLYDPLSTKTSRSICPEIITFNED